MRQKPAEFIRVSEDCPRPLHIVHIALQGCLKSKAIDYGITSDTGGHIRYLLELVDALKLHVSRQTIVTRLFDDEALGKSYAQAADHYDARVDIRRLRGSTLRYLPKEELHRELSAMGEDLINWLAGLPDLPDFIHAHYADAGIMAAKVKRELGIPFVFTAHSLGAVKKQTLQRAQPGIAVSSVLERRIRQEQTVIEQADLVVASSVDEKIVQYGLYDRVNTPITVNAPGCNFASFAVQPPVNDIQAIFAKIAPFLTRPHLPMLLALARPVVKKNLAGLVKAYAHNEALRNQANLVIFAGCRHDLAGMESESRETLQELLYLVDRYDLYGSVALPKQHRPSDVQAIYAAAVKSGGVFMNPALNEPFGLTLLEAGAAGLPVVATDQGGPRDIIARCQHGVTVDPTDTHAIGVAALEILRSQGRWRSLAARGKSNVAYYDWDRHGMQYLLDVAPLIKPTVLRPKRVTHQSNY